MNLSLVNLVVGLGVLCRYGIVGSKLGPNARDGMGRRRPRAPHFVTPHI